MCCYLEKMIKIGIALTAFTWRVGAAGEIVKEKALKLKLGFDSALDTNETPILQVRNFEGSELLSQLNEKIRSKRSERAESSSKSEEDVSDKEGMKGNVEKARESELSDDADDADSSESEGDRRLSTKGLVPDDFEPESNPNIHERYSKDSESE